MSQLFKNNTYFSILFFIALLIDIVVKVIDETSFFRFITKPIVMILLLCYYYINQREHKKRSFYIMLTALSLFLIGDVFLILYKNQVLYIIGIFMFILAKLSLVLRFSNRKDFEIRELVPFLIFCFIYMFGLLSVTYDNLGAYFLPVLIYLFICMITLLFAILRRGVVNKLSFLLVLFGVFFSGISESIAILQSFYNPDIPYHKILVMLFYGLGQYFIVKGIVYETNLKLVKYI